MGALLIGCGQGGATTAGTPRLVPTPNATQTARLLTDTAEARYLSVMGLDLAELVRAQPWFDELSQAHLELIDAVQKTERAAKARGEADSVLSMLKFASEQAWYSDGLDEDEARGLRGTFEAYTQSLADRFSPTIGPVLATTLEFGLFRAVELPEGGEIILVVSADDPEVGWAVIDMAVEYLPQIEELVGAYPYSFLHLMVSELEDLYAGLSYDEFIVINPDYVDAQTVVHELTHSTMYGKFPIWFEEGFAHFVEYYLTDTIDEGATRHGDALAYLGYDSALYVGVYRDQSFEGYIAERAQGFFFMKAVYDLNGIDGVIGAVRELRTHSLNDQELLRSFVRYGDAEQRQRMEDYFCEAVVGTSRDYCVPKGPF